MNSYDPTKPLTIQIPIISNVKGLEAWLARCINSPFFNSDLASFEMYRYCKLVIDSIFESADTDNYYWPAVRMLESHFNLKEDFANEITNCFMLTISSQVALHIPKVHVSPSTCVTIGEGYIVCILILPQ
jgi:hypothetical protein